MFIDRFLIKSMQNMEDFITKMAHKGWKVTWKDSRKNITFENEDGKKAEIPIFPKHFI